MAGDLGGSIAREVPDGESMAWAVNVRTAVIVEMMDETMDEMTLDCIDKGCTQVLNLGASLDTRAFRLPLPPTLSWLDVDLPNRVTLDEAVRLQRPPPMARWWAAFVPPWWPGSRHNLRRMSGVALMEAWGAAAGR